MTSIYEGLSLSFLEALFCRLPIIVTQLPFVDELNQAGCCAVVIPQNDSLKLSQVLMNESFFVPDLDTLKVFQTRFSFDTFAKEHLSLYHNLLG